MSSRLGILCLHVDTYTSPFVFQPSTMYSIRSKYVFSSLIRSFGYHTSQGYQFTGCIYLAGFNVRCLYSTLKDLLHFSVGEEEAVYSTATAQIHLEM